MTDAAQHRHPTFWFSDGNIVLLVHSEVGCIASPNSPVSQAEQTLFNVHRAFLSRESEFFADMFALPQAEDARDGTEEQPLLLLEVAADTLANILTMMYTICGLELSFDVEQLVDMLRVSHRLQFGNISTVVRGKVHPLLGPQRHLRLALDGHGVEQWGLPAFHELICAFETHVEVTTPPLLDHTVWTAVYATRVKIMQSRMTKAVDIATGMKSSNKQCEAHHKAVYRAINSSGSYLDVAERLAALDFERRSCGVSTCSFSVGPPRKWAGLFEEEDDWVQEAWDIYQTQGGV